MRQEEEKLGIARAVGLCADCRYMRLIESDRRSKFYLCERSVTDPSFSKYPRLPVLQCGGYETGATKKEKSTDEDNN